MSRARLVCALAAALAGCALGVSEPRARLPVEGFAAYPTDARIHVEPGYEAYAARVAAELPAAIAAVETAHYLPFVRPPLIYVCGTETCFKRYVRTPRLSAAVVPDNRLILSPNLDGRERNRLRGLLRHELAHLHLGQRIGHYHSTLPVWFHEGWASLTADGGGAEFASDAQVAADVRAGLRIDFTLRDTPDTRHRADAYGLSIYAFYRQSMLAVGWLKAQDEDRFRRLVLAVQDNADFGIAFADVYGTDPATRLAGFFTYELAQNPMRDNSPLVPAAASAAP